MVHVHSSRKQGRVDGAWEGEGSEGKMDPGCIAVGARKSAFRLGTGGEMEEKGKRKGQKKMDCAHHTCACMSQVRPSNEQARNFICAEGAEGAVCVALVDRLA